MSLNNHLVVMARAPRLGRVKHRLAADIGTVAAWRFYRLTAGRLLHRVAGDPRWDTWLAVTPDAARRAPRSLWPGPARLVGQGRGDLGARMGRLLTTLPPGPAVIVGTDIPALGPDQVARAFRELGSADWVFGPAEDGGYWLIGARRRPALRLPFAKVRWSTRHALADTLANLRGERLAFLEVLRDVDDGADLARCRPGEPDQAVFRCSCKRGMSSTRLHGRCRESS